MLTLGNYAVTASVPCFNANRYVRRAVESLLRQTHRELNVVAVNDGDPNPPWPELAHIRDRRLIRFNLARNHGPYFVHQVVLQATSAPYLLIQDADDWSAPNRVSILLKRLLTDEADFVFSAWQQYRQGEDGALELDSLRWRRKQSRDLSNDWLRTDSPESYLFDPHLTDRFINRASHHGVFRRTALERIGGYYWGFRINHDTLLTNLLLMTGRISFVDTPLYHYVIRPDSLSHSQSTGSQSQARIGARQQQATLYKEALNWYKAWTKQGITSVELVTRIRGLATQFVRAEDRIAIESEATRLATLMRGDPRNLA